MNRVASDTRKKPRRQVRFPGLVTDAERLGVHRMHLYQVLAGKRKSKRLMQRYQEIKHQDAQKKEVE